MGGNLVKKNHTLPHLHTVYLSQCKRDRLLQMYPVTAARCSVSSLIICGVSLSFHRNVPTASSRMPRRSSIHPRQFINKYASIWACSSVEARSNDFGGCVRWLGGVSTSATERSATNHCRHEMQCGHYCEAVVWRRIYHNGNFKLTTEFQFETNCLGPLFIACHSVGGLRRPLFYHLATI